MKHAFRILATLAMGAMLLAFAASGTGGSPPAECEWEKAPFVLWALMPADSVAGEPLLLSADINITAGLPSLITVRVEICSDTGVFRLDSTANPQLLAGRPY